MSKKINVLEIIMTEEAVNDKDIGNDISNLIQLIDGLLREKDNLINTYCQEEIAKEIA